MAGGGFFYKKKRQKRVASTVYIPRMFYFNANEIK